MLAHEAAKARRISAGKGCVRMRRKLVRSIASNCRSGCVTKLWRSSAAGKTAPPLRWRRSKKRGGLRRYCFCTNTPATARAIQRSSSDHGEIIGMFAAGITVIVDVAVLFPATGSTVAADALTTAVFVIGPGVDGSVIVSVNVAVAPFVSVPALQVMVVVPLHAPDGVDDCSVVPAGSVSVTVTAEAVLGPRFVTPIVYVSGCPVPYGPGAGVLVMERSASAGETVVT